MYPHLEFENLTGKIVLKNIKEILLNMIFHVINSVVFATSYIYY